MPSILLQKYPKLQITLLEISPRISTGTNYENKSEVTLKEKQIQKIVDKILIEMEEI